MTKKLMSMTFVFLLILSMLTTNVMAAERPVINATNDMQLSEEVLDEVQVVLIPDNLTKLIKQVDAKGQNAQIQVSENLILEKTTAKIDTFSPINIVNRYSILATSYQTTVTSTYTLKSVVGITVATLRVQGVFLRDGSKVEAIDCTGTVSTSYPGWSGDTTTESMRSGSTTGYSWAKAKFHLEYYVGIDPVGMTLQTVEMSGKVFCNPSGGYYSEWI